MTAAVAAGAGPSKEEGSTNKDAMPPAPELVKKPAKKVVKKPQPPPGPEGSHVTHVTGEAAAATAEPPSAAEEEVKSSVPVKKRVVRVVKAKAPQASSSDATPSGATPSSDAVTLGATPSNDATPLIATPNSDAIPLGTAPLDSLSAADEGLGGSLASPPPPVSLPASSCTPADANGASAALHVESPAKEVLSPVSKTLPASLLTPPRRPKAAPTSHASASKHKVDPAEADNAGPCQEPPHDQVLPKGGSLSELSPAAHVGSPSTAVSEAAAEAPTSGSQTAASADKEADHQPQDDALLAHTLPGSSLPPAQAPPAEDSHGRTTEPSGPPDLPVPSPPSAPGAISCLGDLPPPRPTPPVSAGGLGGLGELSRAALEALAVQLHETAAEGRGQLVKDAEQISYLQQVCVCVWGGGGVITRRP